MCMANGLILLIKLYQYFFSCLVGPCCRFQPSCSHYGIQALGRFGLVRGLGLTIWRVLRCGPWSRGGYDPCP